MKNIFKSKKNLVIITSALVVVVALCLYFSFNPLNTGGSNQTTTQKIESNDSNDQLDDDSNESSEGLDKNDQLDSVEDKEVDSAEDLPDGSSWRNRIKNNFNTGQSNSGTTGRKDEEESIQFPYSIPNSNLVIKNLAGYDGVYVEDGSDSDISNVAAILVENTGSSDLDYFRINMVGDDGTYYFTGTGLPAHSQMIVMAENQALFNGRNFKQAGATVSDDTTFELSENEVEFSTNNDGDLEIKNISGSNIPVLRVFYKFYSPEQSAFVGGITYSITIENLEAGKSTTVSSNHYAGDSSKIVMAKIYAE